MAHKQIPAEQFNAILRSQLSAAQIPVVDKCQSLGWKPFRLIQNWKSGNYMVLMSSKEGTLGMVSPDGKLDRSQNGRKTISYPVDF